jgi:hypothetical protein
MAETNRGAGADGSRGATYNDQGDLTGPDSPAGDAAGRRRPEEGQGDDLVDRLGGGEGTGAGLSGAGAETGDLYAADSEATAPRPPPGSATILARPAAWAGFVPPAGPAPAGRRAGSARSAPRAGRRMTMQADRDRAADRVGGLDLGALADRDRDAPGGEGDLTGGDADAASAPGNMPIGTGSLAGLDGSGIAVEAASYGPADGALADAAAAGEGGTERQPGAGPTGGEAIGEGAGPGEPGSGTPGDRGETGGGPAGLHGGTGPEGSASPDGGGGQ